MGMAGISGTWIAGIAAARSRRSSPAQRSCPWSFRVPLPRVRDRLALAHDPTSAGIAQAPARAINAGNVLDTGPSLTFRPEQEVHHNALVLLVHVGAGRGDAADLAGLSDEWRDFGPGD